MSVSAQDRIIREIRVIRLIRDSEGHKPIMHKNRYIFLKLTLMVRFPNRTLSKANHVNRVLDR